MDDTDKIVMEMAERMMRETADPQELNAKSDEGWRGVLWEAIEEMELPRAWVPEDMGGVGLAASSILELADLAGRYALPAPFVETLIAHRIAALAGMELPSGAITLDVHDPCTNGVGIEPGGKVTARIARAPLASVCKWALLQAVEADGTARLALVDLANCVIEPARNYANDPQDTLVLDGVAAEAVAELPAGHDPQVLYLTGAALRAAQMAGAMQSIIAMSVDYSQERVAFGRPIARFQAVQHNIAKAAGDSAAALAVSRSTAASLESLMAGEAADILPLAAAKIRCGEAAGRVAAMAHQVFGAMGFTAESTLHRFTHRLWSWRDDFGGEAQWAVRLGEIAAARGPEEYWPMILGEAAAVGVAHG